VQGPEFCPQHQKKKRKNRKEKQKKKDKKQKARQLSGKVLNCVFIFFIV
jgi:hypothetical protein